MKPFSITIDGKTTSFGSSEELWNWCIKNKPDWVKLPNSTYNLGIEDESFYKEDFHGVDFAELVQNSESYSSFGCIDE